MFMRQKEKFDSGYKLFCEQFTTVILVIISKGLNKQRYMGIKDPRNPGL